MDNLLTYKTWIVLGIFLALFVCERTWPATKTPPAPWLRVLKNLAFWPINIVLSLSIILPVTYFASQHTLWQKPWLLPLDILLLDMFLYFWHKALHVLQLLWRFHEVHHLDEHLDTTSAIRFHFGEIFFATLVRAVVIIVFAIPFSSVVVFEVLVLACALFHHSNLAIPKLIEGPLSKIIVTPSLHWVHHHAKRADTDSNYGTIFSFWDIIFKSRSPNARKIGMPIGVEGGRDKPFLDLLAKPFRPRK